MLEQLIAHFAAGAHNHVQHARGNAGLLENLHHFGSCKRGQRGRLEDHGIAGYQRRRDFPDGNGDGKIPRGDGRDHAQRLLHRVSEVLGQLAGQRLAAHAPRLAGHELQDVDGFLDLAERVFDCFALFARQDPRQLFFLLFHHQRGFGDYAPAHRRRRVAPRRKPIAGRGDGLPSLFAGRKRRQTDDFVKIGRITPLDRAARA